MLEIKQSLKKWVFDWLNKNQAETRQIKSYADVLTLAETMTKEYLWKDLTITQITVANQIEYLLCEKYHITNIIQEIYGYLKNNQNKTKEEIVEECLKNIQKKFQEKIWKGNPKVFEEIIDKKLQWLLWYLNWK